MNRLHCLFHAQSNFVARTLAVSLNRGDSMSCRVARLPQDFASMKLVYCCECGSSNLEMFHTAKTVGPHPVPDLYPVQD